MKNNMEKINTRIFISTISKETLEKWKQKVREQCKDYMENMNAGKVEIIDNMVPLDDFTAKWQALTQEERDKIISQRMHEIREEQKIKYANDLQINLEQLRDLLDFNTYSAFRFQFHEFEAFSLEFIIRLIKKYKINNCNCSCC